MRWSFSPGTRFCTGSAQGHDRPKAATRWGSEDKADQSTSAWSKPPGWARSDLIHRPGEGTSLREGWCREPARKLSISSLGRGCGEIERFSVDQHPMHDHGKLAGERYLRLLHADA